MATTLSPAPGVAAMRATLGLGLGVGLGPDPAGDLRRAPVIALAYAHSGVARLQRVLAGNGALACTAGSGLLELCDQAATTWRRLGEHQAPLSSPALTSIRAMADEMIAVILAHAAGSRWCEISFAAPRCAETFLELYPAARVLCLHRSCAGVIEAGLQASPWGLSGTAVQRFAAGYPASRAAAIAGYWATRTEALLDLEDARPATCRRVRHEDLVKNPDQEADGVFGFLDLARPGPAGPLLISAETGLAPEDAYEPRGDAAVLADELPPRLFARVNHLQARLGYQPIA
jgi:Sulfotransferase family